MSIDSQTQLNMVIGHPLDHSKSPQLHNLLYKKYGINAKLLAFSSETLEPMIHSIKNLNVSLTAVTMPFKKKVIPFLDASSDEVRCLQAANTIIQKQGKLYGYNTDVAGIAYALRDTALSRKKILIIGAGGAAHAAGFYLKSQNSKLFWQNRTLENVQHTLPLFGGEFVATQDINKINFDIIINSIPVGLYPQMSQMPLPSIIFKSHQIVFDMIYNPIETAFLKKAKLAGAKTISGMTMFIGQGIHQIELWLEKKLPDVNCIEEMSIALSK